MGVITTVDIDISEDLMKERLATKEVTQVGRFGSSFSVKIVYDGYSTIPRESESYPLPGPTLLALGKTVP